MASYDPRKFERVGNELIRAVTDQNISLFNTEDPCCSKLKGIVEFAILDGYIRRNPSTI